MRSLPPYNCWQPYTLEQLTQQLAPLDWILAGGNALQLFVGEAYRTHQDIDILLLREDQLKLVQCIELESIFVTDGQGGLLSYDSQKYYEKPIQDLWCLNATKDAWGLQIMLFDCKNNYWIYKRNPAIRLPMSQIYFEKENCKFLKPEIQLLYKSKNIRDKDQFDFETLVPLLDTNAKQWLFDRLSACYAYIHPWILALDKHLENT